MSLFKVLFIAAIGVVISAPVAAQHWPRFRGPAGSGIADNQPARTDWDAASGRGVLWKTPVPGIGHSSPVVWGDRVFISTAISSAAQGHYNPRSEEHTSELQSRLHLVC